MVVKNKTVKLISTFLIISVLMPTVLFSKPKEVSAQLVSVDPPVAFITGITAVSQATATGANLTETGISIKKVALEVLRRIAMTIAKRAVQQMTKSTINWINSGFHGAPLFLENPQSFFKDIGEYEVKTFIDQIGYNSLKYPFGKNFALNTIGSYKRQFAENAQYTLSKVINDPTLLRNYRTDFNVGGWNGFLINTQYPQNNYLGFQMLATEELARRLEGTVQNNAQKIKTTLEQGMGFLSPQTCPSNPLYNNTKNQFQQPRFNAGKEVPYKPPVAGSNDTVCTYTPFVVGEAKCEYTKEFQDRLNAYNRQYDIDVYLAEGKWYEKNGCPGGLVNTTPGSVVGSSIMNALNSGQRQGELAIAMGNSISAIVDALLNKFIGSGLNALRTTKNPPPKDPDTWDYDGNTLGSASPFSNAPWDAGPDEEIDLNKVKKQIDGKTIVAVTDADGTVTATEEIGNTGRGEYIPGDIANTETELRLMSNESATEPGIMQMLGVIWPKVRELDICIPGPDVNWQERIFNEMNRNSKVLQEKSGDDNGDKSAQADIALKELKFAADFFEDWIANKMMTELPNSVLYMDAVDEIETLSQQAKELTDRKRTKAQALARLQAIKSALDDRNNFSKQPEPGSAQEKVLITLRKQYIATSDAISNVASIDNARNELAVAKEKYLNLNKLVTECRAARTAKGWENPGGWKSKLGRPGGPAPTPAPGPTPTPAPGPTPICQPPAEISIYPNNIPSGTVGAMYTTSLTAVGGPSSAYNWNIISGVIPPGIYTSDCAKKAVCSVVGTPTVAGTYTFTLRTDISGTTATASKQYTIVINPPNGPTANLKINGSDSWVNIRSGDSVNVSLTSSNATSCILTPSGYSATSGTVSYGPITSSVLASVRCAGAGGTIAADEVYINVNSCATQNEATSATGLSISGNKFILGGTAKFLMLAGYFDGMDSGNVSADLDYLKSKGIDGVRVFPNWWNWIGKANDSTQDDDYDDNTLFNSNGTIKSDRLNKLKQIIESAATKGMVVDVSFARETVFGPCETAARNKIFRMMCEPEYKNAAVSTVSSLKNYTNIFYDLQNEFDGDITNLSESSVRDLKSRIKAADSDAIVSASNAGDGQVAPRYAQT